MSGLLDKRVFNILASLDMMAAEEERRVMRGMTGRGREWLFDSDTLSTLDHAQRDLRLQLVPEAGDQIAALVAGTPLAVHQKLLRDIFNGPVIEQLDLRVDLARAVYAGDYSKAMQLLGPQAKHS